MPIERDVARYQALLQAYMADVFPERVAPIVLDLHEISSGWESDVFAFDMAYGPTDQRRSEPLVLRIYPGADAEPKSQLEYNALRQLHSVGYPVPKVDHLAQASSPFGRPFLIMERVPGRTIWHETFHGPEDQQRARFNLFIRLLVDLHELDWHQLISDDVPTPWVDDPYHFIDGWLSQFRGYIVRFSQPGYEPLLTWLGDRRTRVPCRRPAPIHWDYHPANILLADDGTATVIDWTQYAISDPRFDLGWTMTLVGAGEGDDIRRQIAETYEAMWGSPVEELDYFEAFACAKRLASVTLSIAIGAEQLGMRPGAEAAMRRQIPSLTRVYARLQHLTGVEVPEVEALLSASA